MQQVIHITFPELLAFQQKGTETVKSVLHKPNKPNLFHDFCCRNFFETSWYNE